MGVRDILQKRINIVKLISGSIELTQQNSVFVGACPMCLDPPPSFKIYPNKKQYECVRCGEKGDILDFVVNILGLNIGDAQDWLAETFAIPLRQLRAMEVLVDPMVKRLSKCNTPRRMENDIERVLHQMATCELDSEQEIECLKRIIKKTGVTLGDLRRRYRIAIEDEKEWEERRDRYIYRRNFPHAL
jgi:DNA primase